MPTILVADDDAHIRELVCLFLHNDGFTTIEAVDGEEALALQASNSVDLVVLDIMMPGMDGWALCRELRRRSAHLPLLMLSARSQTWEKVKGFEIGADDYLTKPFDPLELTVRVRALLKRSRSVVDKTVTVGKSLKLDRNTYKVTAGVETFTLPLKEFELLYTLAETPGQVYTREQLIERIWGIDYTGDNRTVDVHIKRLRERFVPFGGLQIETVRGLGYRLEVEA
ncbi:response regulator transcription factor [Saccharibacillus sp. JS10]|uniref:response regulator transcription factor n=1 Tax=Saccharibacillus sp. JS10 TaxID=2950552 RepID=UPI00210CF9ED|nr:response regulator transcription factor [Saccharibacillus sp. JS10]MCQ4087844.1 response regulator transcription factor [Saccharibacillus sp. JS10]